jgi:PAS domain-containing protein
MSNAVLDASISKNFFLPGMNLLKERRESQIAAAIDWEDVGQNEHFVQFYESDEFLVETLAGFIGPGLRAGESTIVIATQAHREALENRLEEDGMDVAAALQSRHYLPLDAAATLSKIMVDGALDENLFRQVVGGLVSEAARSGTRLRIFGEMVALLWPEGNEAAGVQLEKLWNEFGKSHSFSLYCAYPVDAFKGVTDGGAFLQICNEHSRIIPVESYAGQPNPNGNLRIIALLQQQASVLHAEIAKRKRMESASRHMAALVASSDDAIVSKDLNGVITTWNEGARRLFGYSAEEITGKPVLLLIPSDRLNEEPFILDSGKTRLKAGRVAK